MLFICFDWLIHCRSYIYSCVSSWIVNFKFIFGSVLFAVFCWLIDWFLKILLCLSFGKNPRQIPPLELVISLLFFENSSKRTSPTRQSGQWCVAKWNSYHSQLWCVVRLSTHHNMLISKLSLILCFYGDSASIAFRGLLGETYHICFRDFYHFKCKIWREKKHFMNSLIFGALCYIPVLIVIN